MPNLMEVCEQISKLSETQFVCSGCSRR